MRTKKEWEILEAEEPLRYWAEVINSRGHAGMHSRRTSDEKKFIERSVVDEWHEVAVKSSKKLKGKISEGEDPPDFFLMADAGDVLSIELVEFVNQELLAEVVKLRRQGINITSHSPGFFEKAQWTEATFNQKLESLVSAKNKKYQKNSKRVDILLIYTDETWLSEHQVSEWIKKSIIRPTDSIYSVDFLMSYVPGREPAYPLLHIC